MANQHNDVLVIGAGLSSLTAAALLAKQGLSVSLVEQHTQPGGSCGSFRLQGRTVDQGTSMFFGFGLKGFNPHRFVMNELEEPIDVIKHDYMYRLNYGGTPILFHSDMEEYFTALTTLFPQSMDGIRKFYAYIEDLYTHVIAADTTFMAPSEIPLKEALKRFSRHPIRNLRILPLLSKSAGELLRKFVQDEEVVKFFSKLTSTYCYTTLDETPAILAVTMFMENHVGGSYYTPGGSQQLPGKLEKAFERYGGKALYRTKAVEILFNNGNPSGAIVEDCDGRFEITADQIIYGGTLLNLYTKLIPVKYRDERKTSEVTQLAMTYPSVVLYAIVNAKALPVGTLPIEMMANNPDKLDEKEVTIYTFSLADPSICGVDEQVVLAIGPSLRPWPDVTEKEAWGEKYKVWKEEEKIRLIAVLEQHFNGITDQIRFAELASPTTIERFTMKEKGSVAGPKQKMGQDLLNRQHAQSQWPTLFHCGEATVMGTGSLAVTISGISAANVALRARKMEEYRLRSKQKNGVKIILTKIESVRNDPSGRRLPTLNSILEPATILLHDAASACQWCLDSPCRHACPKSYEISGIMRRLECGNVFGARKLLGDTTLACIDCSALCEKVCTAIELYGKAVEIKNTLITVEKTVV